MARPLQFVWGPGGVGKTHFSIYESYRSEDQSHLLTLDPSPRLLDLLGLPRIAGPQEARILERSLIVRQTDADDLFQRLNRIKPANDAIKNYYQELVGGLHRFRDYLCLLDLAEEIQKNEDFRLIVDTPPLSEARGLSHSIQEMHHFFRSPIFQMSMKSSLVQTGVRRAIDFGKSFLGKVGVDQALEFVEWLGEHLDTFKASTSVLEDLLFDEKTQHTLIFSPESSIHQLDLAQSFFKDLSQLRIILNRSVLHLPEVPETFESLKNEISRKKGLETQILQALENRFPKAKIELFPLQLMGEDSSEEMQKFLQTELKAFTR